MKRFLTSLTAGVAMAVSVSAADSLPRLTQLLAETFDAQMQLDVLRGLTFSVQGRRSVPMPVGWDAVEKKLAGSPNAEVRTLAQSLSLKFGSPTALAALRETAADASANGGARRAAVESLLAVRDTQLPSLLHALLKEPELRGVALRGLAGFDDAKTASAVLAVYSSLGGAEKRDALNTLASRLVYAKPLLSAVAEQKIPRADLTAELVRQLRNLKDAGLAKQIDEAWGIVKEASPDQEKEIAKFRAVYQAGGSQPGNAANGRVLYNQLCAQCHHLFDFGGAVGPDITGANRGDVGYLLENILYPNAVIPIDYRVSTIEMKDDRVLTGIVKERTAQALVVQTPNEKLTLPLAEVKKVDASEFSMMPEGLIAQLKDQQIRDLLYYLGRPGQVPLPAGAK